MVQCKLHKKKLPVGNHLPRAFHHHRGDNPHMKPFLYLGDDHVGGAAAYLTGVLTHFGLPLQHVASGSPPQEPFNPADYATLIVSDYSSSGWLPGQMQQVADAVAGGIGLLMIGGWESFHGRKPDGEYNATPFAELLPVTLADTDDRLNFPQPCLIRRMADPGSDIDTLVKHPITDGLPWESCVPGIGGLNRFTAKPGSQTLLETVPFTVRRVAVLGTGTTDEQNTHDEWNFTPEPAIPLLVVGNYGRGRVAALACDVAPHWVGGFVDWGTRRIAQPLSAAAFPELNDDGFIEVGADYAVFLRNLARWTAGDDGPF